MNNKQSTDLIQRRKAAGISRNQLAQLAGITTYQMYWLEHPGRDIKGEAELLEKVYGVLQHPPANKQPTASTDTTVKKAKGSQDISPSPNVGKPIVCKPETIPLDHLAKKIALIKKQRNKAAALLAQAKELEAEVKAEMGDAEYATLNGVPAVAWSWRDAYAWARFADAHPDLVNKYSHEELTTVIDFDGLKSDYPDLVHEFQVRDFRFLGKKPTW